MSEKWCEFAAYPDAASAEVVAGLLRNESVPVHVAGDEPVPGLVRGFRVLVPPGMLHRAKSIAKGAQISDEELATLATGESDDADESAAASPADAKYIPTGWPALIPRIVVDDPEGLVAFVKGVFGAVGRFNAQRPTELRINGSLLMISSAAERNKMPAFLYVYVADADAVYERAMERGAKPIEKPQDTPYGDRRAMIQDPWGNLWQIATHRGQFR